MYVLYSLAWQTLLGCLCQPGPPVLGAPPLRLSLLQLFWLPLAPYLCAPLQQLLLLQPLGPVIDQ